MTNLHEIEEIQFTHFNEPINENTWQQIHESILKINEIISSHTNSTNLVELSTIINSINFYDNFIINCLSSDRTRLSGVTVDLLITLCNMFNKFKSPEDLKQITTVQSFDRYLKTTLLVCNKVNRVLQTRGEHLLLTFAENDILFFRSHRAIVETTNSKSKIQRLSLFKALAKFVKKHVDRVGQFEKLQEVFIDIMKNGIRDASPEIRAIAKEFVVGTNNGPKVEHKSIKEIIQETKGSNTIPPNSNSTLKSQRLYDRLVTVKTQDLNDEIHTIKQSTVLGKNEMRGKKIGKKQLDSSTDMIYQNLAASAELYKNSPMKKITRLKNNLNKSEDEIFTPRSLKTFLSKYRPDTKEENLDNSKKNIQKLSDEISKLMVQKNIQNKLNTKGVDIEELKKNFQKEELTENKIDLENYESHRKEIEIDEYNNLQNELQEIEAYKIKELGDLENSFQTNENIIQEDSKHEISQEEFNEEMEFVIEKIENTNLVENTLSHEYIHETTPINENNRSLANAVYLNNSQQNQNTIFEPEIMESSSNGESELDKLVSLADEEKLKSDFEDEEIREQNLILEEYEKENILENEEKLNQQEEISSMNVFNILSAELQNKETTELQNKETLDLLNEEVETNESKKQEEVEETRKSVKITNKRKPKNKFKSKRKFKKTSKESPGVHEISLILSKEQEIENSQTEIKERNNLLENREEDTVNDLDKSLLDLSVEVIKKGEEDK